jgi:hypothetical protein
MERLDLIQDLKPIMDELRFFWGQHPEVSQRLKRAHVMALAESAQKFPSVQENHHELFYAMGRAGLLLVCEEVCPGVMDELLDKYAETLQEIFPNIDFSDL